MELEVTPTLEQEIRKSQLEDEKLKEIVENIVLGKAPGFRMDENGTLWFGKTICVPEVKTICEAILREAHESAYSIHPGSTKMFLDLKEKYWWYGLNRDVTEYVPESESGTSETCRVATTNEDTQMEVGRSWYGFYY
jgi:hypothetical protein